MKRIWSYNDFKYHTYMRSVLSNLHLDNSNYVWLISDIDAYPMEQKYQRLLNQNDGAFVLLTTNELVDMLDKDDFQWIFAVFSAIPSKYSKDEILSSKLPYIQSFTTGQYNPYEDPPKLQHPYAELEILCSESGLALVSQDDKLIDTFRKCYPHYTDYFSISYRSLIAFINEYPQIANKIYICNFLNCDKNKIKNAEITIITNIFGKYVVTDWLDYERGQYLERIEFSDKDEAAEFTWKLFVKKMTLG